MSQAYYNENDPFAAQWLRNLIAENLIAPGVVDTRDIRDVRPVDLVPYTQQHFFAGIGGWSLALRLAGVPDDFPVWTGSCPCQPFSQAGLRRGFADERHLWPYWRYLVAVRRPAKVLGEQVSSAANWLRLVRGDLEALGYAVGAIPVEAASAGADHLRDRYWFVADDAAPREGRGRVCRSGESESASGVGPPDQPAGSGPNGVDQVDAGRAGLAQRPFADFVGGDVRQEGPATSASGYRGNGLAHSGLSERRLGDQQPAGEQPQQQHSQARNGDGSVPIAARQQVGTAGLSRIDSSLEYEWVTGADGKQRRVKPGVRLLTHALSGRVAVERPIKQAFTANPYEALATGETEMHWYNRIGTLKGFGNAIDPRPAAAFIKAALNL